MGNSQLAGFVLACSVWATPAWATTYTIDPGHSTVSFRIRHLFTQVQGVFRDFNGTVDYVPGQPGQWKAEATIQTASIDTRVEKRDTHLRSKDFFHAGPFPAITFKSAQVIDATATGGKLEGVLTMHGVERPVTLEFAILGEGKDPWGNQRAGFHASTKLNRKEFGVIWNEKLETGDLLLGEEVQVELDIEGIVK